MRKNKKLKIVLLILLVIGINQGFTQSLESMSQGLITLGFENIRAVNSEGIYYVSVENNVYRSDPLAIAEALDLISGIAADSSELHLILVEKGIPYNLISVNSNSWKDFRNGTLDREQFSDRFQVTWEIDEAWDKLKGYRPKNPNTKKIDVVVYPQLSYQNIRLAKIYETQFNIAPAVEFSVWRGNKITGQVIFPVHNELGYEGDFIRPGFLTLSQEFRPHKRWLGKFSAGNFNNSRYGFDLYLLHPFQNENWNLEIRAGATGNSHFFDSKWTHGKLNSLTWSSSLSWFYSRYNIVLKAGAAQYIYNDMGLFATCTRYFGETTVGFFAYAYENRYNGGFRVTIPFPLKKRSTRKFIRLTTPKHFGISYNSNNEFYYRQSFRTNPDENKIKFLSFTRLFKNQILNLKN